MAKGENAFVAWLARRYGARSQGADGVVAGIGDDMAVLRLGANSETSKGKSRNRKAPDARPLTPDPSFLVTCDMLMDGVDFDTRVHSPVQIGRKALAVSLSDCAAMAVRPRWAVVSVALPESWSMAQAKGLYLGMEPLAKRYGCRIVGGDTNSWRQGLVIDVTVLAEPWPSVQPVRRDGMRPGDVIVVSGPLGGSLAGHHLTFEPRVEEARRFAEILGDDLHAMMDLSDGLSVDGARLAAASGSRLELSAGALEAAATSAARRARDGRGVMEHVLNDGEDFELLMAVSPGGVDKLIAARGAGGRGKKRPSDWHLIGWAERGQGVWLMRAEGARGRWERVEPKGWQHFVK